MSSLKFSRKTIARERKRGKFLTRRITKEKRESVTERKTIKQNYLQFISSTRKQTNDRKSFSCVKQSVQAVWECFGDFSRILLLEKV